VRQQKASIKALKYAVYMYAVVGLDDMAVLLLLSLVLALASSTVLFCSLEHLARGANFLPLPPFLYSSIFLTLSPLTNGVVVESPQFQPVGHFFFNLIWARNSRFGEI